jgi:hypothetical protein
MYPHARFIEVDNFRPDVGPSPRYIFQHDPGWPGDMHSLTTRFPTTLYQLWHSYRLDYLNYLIGSLRQNVR